jgi:putative ABC transport system ATP-binding protein
MAFEWFQSRKAAAHPQPQVGDDKSPLLAGMPLIRLRELKKSYHSAAGDVPVLGGINLDIYPGEFVGIMGKSGSGKTTLLNMIAGIDRPTSGEVWVAETPIHQLSEGQMAIWRGRNLGIIFQFFQLLPMLTLLDNVMLPMDFSKMYTIRQRHERALELLDMVEMADHAYKLPSTISGGQQQRVAIARALASDPPLVVADEPTGNLDSKTAQSVFDLFQKFVDQGKTFVIVTHDTTLAERLNRAAYIADGQIVSDRKQGERKDFPQTRLPPEVIL